MNAIEAITKIKVMLGLQEETTATVESVEFAEATLVDGTVVRVDGDFEVGKPIFVVTEEGDVPAPDAQHETTDGLIVTTEAGVIVSIEEKTAEETPAEEVVVEAKTETPATEAQFSEDFVNSLVETLAPALDKIEALRNDLANLKAEFSTFKEAPATKKITNNLQDYKTEQMSKHDARFEALKQIRKNFK